MNTPNTQQSDSLADLHIAILGLGLMGGSLALALRGCCRELTGIDPDPGTLTLVKEKDAVTHLNNYPDSHAAKADLIILAAPVKAILSLLHDLPAWHPGSPVVLDVGSTKREIVAAMGALPARFDPIGGHPMCGKEQSSFAAADAQLFQGQPFTFTPLERTSARARYLAAEIAQAVGGLPLWLDADTHDRWVAATSHLPYLVANALAAVTPIAAAPLVGPGFRSTTRVASTSPRLMLDILATNCDNVLQGLAGFRRQLDELEAQLRAGNWPAFTTALNQGAANRQELLVRSEGKTL
jgi:prephenate dehydrogenase